MYQVIDACVATAEPTEELDAVTVGMVCVRNIQVSNQHKQANSRRTVVNVSQPTFFVFSL